MRANEKKRVFRCFTIADYEKEAAFLREQHNKGYKFVRFAYPGFYYFEACEPEDVVYQLDFSDLWKKDKPQYVQLFKDYDWEYLFDVNGWSYFRKKADSAGENIEIFSDNESKIALVERTFRRRMVPLLIIFLTVVIPQLMLRMNRADNIYLGITGYIFRAFWILMFILYICLLIHCGYGLMKLKKKYLGQNG